MSTLAQLLARAQDVRTETLTADGIEVRVREPTGAAHARYGALWSQGKEQEAVTHLLRHCVIGESGTPILNDEQAAQLAGASSKLVTPIIGGILRLATPEKQPDAPGADAVPHQPAAGAPAVGSPGTAGL